LPVRNLCVNTDGWFGRLSEFDQVIIPALDTRAGFFVHDTCSFKNEEGEVLPNLAPFLERTVNSFDISDLKIVSV